MNRVRKIIHTDYAYKTGLSGKNVTVAIMIDFVYYRKTLSGEQVKRDVQFMMRAIAKPDAGLAVLLPRTAVL